MPDGDRYNRNVEKLWQKAARYAYERENPELLIREVMLALRGCQLEGVAVSLPDMIRVAATTDRSVDIRRQLERVAHREYAEIMQIAAERLLLFRVDPSVVIGESVSAQGLEKIEVAIAKDILMAIAWTKISPGMLRRSLKRLNPLEQMTRRARLERNLTEVRRSAAIEQLAQQLVQGHVSLAGGQIAVPRIEKRSQEELVYAPLPL